MSEVEYVAVVQVHRVERNAVPKVMAGTSRRTVAEDRATRQKAEVLSFTVRAGGLLGIRTLVTGMMEAGMPEESIKGELYKPYEEEMEDDG